MVGDRPVNCLAENALSMKHDRHKRENAKKSRCKHGGMNDGGGRRQAAVRAIGREK